MSAEDSCKGISHRVSEYDYDILHMNEVILTYYNTALTSDSLEESQRNLLRKKLDELTQQKEEEDRLLLRYSDVKFLQTCLNSGEKDLARPTVYLHELLKNCELELPSPAPLIRTAEYEAKMRRLRILADEAQYQKMTRNVSTTSRVKEESIGKELKKMDSQVTFLFNFVITVLGAFAFGYKGVEYSLPTPNVSLQLTAGMTLATIVFFADVYFIIKEYV